MNKYFVTNFKDLNEWGYLKDIAYHAFRKDSPTFYEYRYKNMNIVNEEYIKWVAKPDVEHSKNICVGDTIRGRCHVRDQRSCLL